MQDEVARRWAACGPGTIAELADTAWFRGEVMRLYGFEVPGVDYSQPSEVDLPWPAYCAAAAQ